MPLVPGQKLGPYEIVSQLGAGGMGEVYRARDSKLKRDVAIKVLPAEVAGDRERLARFQREAEVLASLNHPHIAHVYGLEGDGQPDTGSLLVMELVDGEDLSQRIARGPIPVDEALPIARQIAEALEAAHDAGIVHRDLKPANVKVRNDGTVKVLDFGLAKAIESSSSSPHLANSPTITSPAMTMQGVILGTAAYMSPEQAKGRAVDRRADIWAFGCVLYEMLTGQRTFNGADVSETIVSVLRDDPRWAALPDDTPPAVRMLLQRCLQRDPLKRLPHIGSARLELNEPTPAQPPAPSTRSPWLVAATLGALAGAIVTAGLVALRWPPTVSPSPVVKFALTPPRGSIFAGGNQVPRFAVSADGKYVVYQLADAMKSDLWIRSIDAVEARVIPGLSTEISGNSLQQAFWSPDGKYIGYFDETTHQLKRVDHVNGAVQVIANIDGNQYGGTWNDAGVILMSSTATNGIQRVSTSGGSVAQVTKVDPAAKETLHLWPRFFPDGKHFTYLALHEDGSTNTVFLASLDGGTAIRLVDSPGSAEPAGDDLLIYVRENVTVAQHLDLANGRLTGEPMVIGDAAARTASGRSAVSASRAGTLVLSPVGSVGEDRFEIAWVDRRGRTLTNGPKATTSCCRAMRLSPDGSRLQFLRSSPNDSSTAALYLLELARGVETRLTDVTSYVGGVTVVFSPDSSELITRTFDRQKFKMLRIPVSGGPGRAIFGGDESDGLIPFDWTRDGKQLLVGRGDYGSKGLSLISPDRPDNPVAITSSPVRYGARISSDGKWVAYAAGTTLRTAQIFLQAFPSGGGRTAVTDAGASYPLWRGDGRELFFVQNGKIMAVTIETTPHIDIRRPQELFDLSGASFSTDPAGSSSPYAVMPSGQGFAIARLRTDNLRETALTVITDWKRAAGMTK